MRATRFISNWLVLAVAVFALGCSSGAEAPATRESATDETAAFQGEYEMQSAKPSDATTAATRSRGEAAMPDAANPPATQSNVGGAMGGQQGHGQEFVGMGGPRAAAAPPDGSSEISSNAERGQPPQPDRNAYYRTAYHGGSAERDRIESQIHRGVLLDGRQVVLAAFTNTFSQALPVPSDEALAVSAKLERSRIVRDGAHTYLQIGLQAIRSETPLRPRLTIALVIDRSGSMPKRARWHSSKRRRAGWSSGWPSRTRWRW